MRTLATRVRALGPARADALLALAFLVEVMVELAVAIPDGTPDRGLAAGILAVEALCLALRRRWPLVTSVATWGAYVAISSLPAPYFDHLLSPLFAVLFMAYSAGRHLSDRRAAVALVAGSAAVSISVAIDSYDDSAANFATTAVFAVWAPLLIGRFMRHRVQLHATLRDKAAQLDRRRRERGEAAAAEERTRIAGELHDVVAHALSAMVVQAGGARRLAERDPALAAVAFSAVESTGREALTEIRALLGVLRREDEELALAPQPSLRHVRSLVDRSRAAGLAVELEIDGEARELPAGIDLTGYRVVQEALRGALEQGRAGHARVRLSYAGDHVDLRVDDDGGAPLRDLPGVRERVSFYGGQLRAGARRAGGHAVRARIPVEAA
jgi:signal transduction histidine kinase